MEKEGKWKNNWRTQVLVKFDHKYDVEFLKSPRVSSVQRLHAPTSSDYVEIIYLTIIMHRTDPNILKLRPLSW